MEKDGLNQNISSLDPLQMLHRTLDKDSDAQRVYLVNPVPNLANITVNESKVFSPIEYREIEKPVIVKEVEIQYIDRPIIVKETEIVYIEKPIIIEKEVIKEVIVEKTVEVPTLKLVEIEKPIIVKEQILLKNDRLEKIIIALLISHLILSIVTILT